MIYHLDGGYETVQYRQKSHLRLYYYTIHEGEILIICPTSIHEIFDEPSGVRFYIQANMSGFQFLSEMDTAYSILDPAVLITKDRFPEIFDRVRADIDNIRTIYRPEDDSREKPDPAMEDPQSVARTALPFMAETQIYALLLDMLSLVARIPTSIPPPRATSVRCRMHANIYPFISQSRFPWKVSPSMRDSANITSSGFSSSSRE